jgi:hypothetical protein
VANIVFSAASRRASVSVWEYVSLDNAFVMDAQTNRNMQIGNVCIQWSGLEYTLAASIWMMIGVGEEVGKIITASLDAKNRAKMLFALAHVYNAPVSYKNAIKKVIKSLQDGLMDRRNVAVHGVHFTSDEPNSVGLEMHRGRGGRGRRTVPNSEFSALGREISDTNDAFVKAHIAYIKKRYSGIAETSVGLATLETILRNNSETKDDAGE